MSRFQIYPTARDKSGLAVPGVVYSLHAYDPENPFFVKEAGGNFTIDELPPAIKIHSARIGTAGSMSLTTNAYGQVDAEAWIEPDSVALVSQIGERRQVRVVEERSTQLVAEFAALNGESIVSVRQDALNEFIHDGSFIDLTGVSLGADGGLRNAASFAKECLSDYFLGFNAHDPSAAIEVGRYYYNSTSNGGSEAQINDITQAFAAVMGITGVGARYMLPWAIAETVMGAGVASDSVDGEYFRGLSTSYYSRLAGVHGSSSLGFWFQPVDDAAFVKGYSASSLAQTYINGVRVENTGGHQSDPSMHAITAGEVVHLAFQIPSSAVIHYVSNGFKLLCKSGCRLRWTCMRAAPGLFQIPPSIGVTRSR